ncbi:DUF885 family protein [Ferrimonas sp. SCSIO 43195]|uniref:DUF885 domain-containing protein n=1 Tax=Ferrimonas sp. SCSIO 43195 TaxID=2822844 RepID=UPI0020764C6C|nr:DUF885 domain-containing protein [Ferrimonas sp. SCSIO 43195]
MFAPTSTYATLAIVAALNLTCAAALAHGDDHRHSATTPLATPQSPANARAEALYEQIFMENVMANPISQAYLGIKQDQDQWDDLSEQRYLQDLTRNKRHLATLQQLDPDRLSGQTALSYRLLTQQLKDDIDDYRWRHYTYPVNQMYGYQSTTPSFLINRHPIDNTDDAKAYIQRLNGMERRFAQVVDQLEIRRQKGIVAPKFVFEYVLDDSRNILTGSPFDDSGQESILWQDFNNKLDALNLAPSQHDALMAQASSALTGPVRRGYQQLITKVQQLQQQASTDDGAWKFPDGQAFYAHALKQTTSTGMSADEIHQLGLAEVARIHAEMRSIQKQVGFNGSLQQFFAFMRTDPGFYLSNDAQGKQAYLQQAEDYLDAMQARLDSVFGIKPKAALEVRQVEAFREKSAGKAFYQQPSPDGSRPGYFYANLHQMADMPTYQLEALAFHEGIPGHHMQIAIAQELQALPKFRRFGSYTAYIEGWGLYSEYLPKEMGFYQDPYSDFGRLAMELWRACRLVVDTGIHDQRWTRQQAIDYLADNTPNPQGDVVKAIERYIVMPSQATAYKIGMLKILQLRSDAQQQLGDKFDLRGFHDVILANGPVPLNVLQQQVQAWVKNQAS